MAKEIRRSSLPVGTSRLPGGCQPLLAPTDPQSFGSGKHHFFSSRSPAGKLKRFFQRYRSQSEAQDDAHSFEESSECLLEAGKGRFFGDVFVCPKCAYSLEQYSMKQQQRQRGVSLGEEPLAEQTVGLHECWQSVHKWQQNSAIGEGCAATPSSLELSSSSNSADSGIPTPTYGDMEVLVGPLASAGECVTPERVLQQFLLQKQISTTTSNSSRRDSGQGEEVKTSASSCEGPVCALCSARMQVQAEESEKYRHRPPLLPTVESPVENASPVCGGPAPITRPPVRFSQRLRLRSISHSESDQNASPTEDLPQKVVAPPKEPSKLPSCMPNSGITFVDAKLKLADKRRLRSLSMSTDPKAFRAAKSKSLVEDGNVFNEFWSTNQQLWQTLHDTRQFHVLEQALAEENQMLSGGANRSSGASSATGKSTPAPCLSRISENHRYVMLSRTPCMEHSKSTDEGAASATAFLNEDIFLALFQHSSMYDALPESGKIVVVDCDLPVERAYHALLNNNVMAAALWDNTHQCFDGIFDLRFFIPICHYFFSSIQDDVALHKRKTIRQWKELIGGMLPASVSLHPDHHLHCALHRMHATGATHVSVFDPVSGNTLGLVHAARMFRYLCHRRAELPLNSLGWTHHVACDVPTFPLRMVNADSVLTMGTPLSRVLELMIVENTVTRVLPVVVDSVGDSAIDQGDAMEVADRTWKLLDVITAVDCVHFLLNMKTNDLTVQDCLKYNLAMHRVIVRCRNNETIASFMDKFYYYDTDFIVVVDNQQEDRFLGVVHIEHFLNWLVLRGEPEEPATSPSTMATTPQMTSVA